MLKQLAIIATITLSSPIWAMTPPQAPRPSERELTPKQKRESFMMAFGSALINAEKEHADEDPSFSPRDFEFGLVKGNDREGMIVSQACEDDWLLQVLMRALNRTGVDSTVKGLGFDAIYCKGTQNVYRIYPARRVKRPVEEVPASVVE
jgi:hypothetical protein